MSGWVVTKIVSKGWYVLLALIIGITTFVVTTWLGNLGLVWQITTSEFLSIADKLKILFQLVGSIFTNFTPLSAFSAIAIAILFGINAALTLYSFRELRMTRESRSAGASAAGVGGLLSGLFGIGCAACGTLLLSPALAFFGASAVIAVLPFGGEEFGVLGVGLLMFSVAMQSRAISRPAICSISPIQLERT